MLARLKSAELWAAMIALLIWMLLCALAANCETCDAAEVPQAAHAYRLTLLRAAHQQWGLDAPVATFAAQVTQESRWREAARSPVGARGLAQFMPSTERWIGSAIPTLNTERPGATNPVWSLNAMVAYDRWLYERVPPAASDCERFAYTLSSYNGGLGWVLRDVRLARAQHDDPTRWWGHVERYNAGRSAAAWRENRGYPVSILRTWEPVFVRAGWGRGACQ